MKYFIKFLGIMLIAMQVTSCNGNLDSIQKQIDDLKSGQIASVSSQITAIQGSISALENVRSQIENNIAELKKSDEMVTGEIDELEKTDEALGKRINELKEYVDNLNKGTRDWATATFSTLDQYKETCNTITSIQLSIKDLGEKVSKDLEKAISSSEKSLKSWVSEQLSDYYTAAQMDVKLKKLQDQIDNFGGDPEVINDIKNDIKQLRSDLSQAKEDLTKTYEKAIKDAVDAQGLINEDNKKSIKDATDAVSSLTSRIGTLEDEVKDIKKRLDAIEGMVQSMVAIPEYSDNSVVALDGVLKVSVMITPATTVKNLTKDNFAIRTVETKGSPYDSFPVSDITVDEDSGVVEISSDLSSVLRLDLEGAIFVAVNLKAGNTDITSSLLMVHEKHTVTIVAGEHGSVGKTSVAVWDGTRCDAWDGKLHLNYNNSSDSPFSSYEEIVATPDAGYDLESWNGIPESGVIRESVAITAKFRESLDGKAVTIGGVDGIVVKIYDVMERRLRYIVVATKNIGATSITDCGTFMNGGEFVALRDKLKDGWYLPSDEFCALNAGDDNYVGIASRSYEFCYVDGVCGMKISFNNGNFLFFPSGGIRESDGSTRNNDKCYLWALIEFSVYDYGVRGTAYYTTENGFGGGPDGRYYVGFLNARAIHEYPVEE